MFQGKRKYSPDYGRGSKHQLSEIDKISKSENDINNKLKTMKLFKNTEEVKTEVPKSSPQVPSPMGTPAKGRPIIPTRENPPPEMPDWLLQFQYWSNAERILAINELIDR